VKFSCVVEYLYTKLQLCIISLHNIISKILSSQSFFLGHLQRPPARLRESFEASRGCFVESRCFDLHGGNVPHPAAGRLHGAARRVRRSGAVFGVCAGAKSGHTGRGALHIFIYRTFSWSQCIPVLACLSIWLALNEDEGRLWHLFRTSRSL